MLKICAAFFLVLAWASTASAGFVTLSWDPSPSEDVAGYVILYGTSPGNYQYSVLVGNHTFATVNGLAGGVTYYFAVEGYSSFGVLGSPSNEIAATTTNAPPVFNDPGPLVLSEGNFVRVQLIASDSDGDPLYYSATGLPPGLTIDATSGVISGTLSYHTTGVYNVTLTVSDGFLPGTLSTSHADTWTVLYVNGPPAVAPVPNQINAENDLVSFTVSAVDPDGDPITWSAAGLPPGLAIDPVSGTIGGQPTFTSAGVYPVTVIATAVGGNGRQTFQWTITNVDRPPVVAPVPNQTSGQYAAVLLAVSGSDPDGDIVSFSASGLPPGLTINAITGEIVGTLSPASVGVYSVTATATANGLTGSANFSWTITNQVAFPLKASANGRYLVDQNNVPFFMVGDSPQTIIGNLSVADATTYLNDRKNRGFNTVWINLVCRTAQYGCSANGTTVDGIKPFTTTGDLSTPNPAYFAKADAILSVAASLNMLVILDPIDTGGWLTVLESNSLATVRAYGQYVGNRYVNYNNIIWMSGNDFQTWRIEADDAKVREVALGIKDVDTRHIHTIELDYTYFASGSLDDPTWAPIIGLEAAYTYYPTYAQVLKGYNRPNFLPVFLVEANYEGENLNGGVDVPETRRRQEYWTALSGSTGQLFGNHYTWTFASGWQSNLNTTGATQLGYMKSLFEPRAWFSLVPDQTHTIMTTGYGTFADGSPNFTVPSGITSVQGNDYATAAATPDGTLMIAYLPTVRTVTVDMSRLSGVAVARWFDPTLGTFASIAGSPYQNVGVVAFTPPAATHADGGHDWVLILEANPGILLQNPGDRSNPRGANIALQIQASDPYGLPLTYSATNLPVELTMNSSTGLITGALVSNPAPFNVTITVTDGSLTASRSFVWTVIANNNPPILTNPGDQVSSSATSVALQLVATDADGIGLSYSATGLPPGLSINSQTGLISGSLSPVMAIYGVTATVSDGLFSNSQTFNWTVQLGNSFVQMNYSDPQTPTASLSVPFPKAQTSGNLNVVVVGWNDSTRQVQSVTDTAGNTYVLAVGPTVRAGAATQAIYYAKNILGAATNTITVVFNGSAAFPDIRIAEYKGLDPVNPLDAAVAGQGNTALTDSGLLTTTNANDLLVAANTQAQGTTSPGTGFTSRVITSPDNDILEDRLVGVVGSYNATAPMTGPGNWIMQLVAFRAAGGGVNHAPTIAGVAAQANAEGTATSLQLAGADPDGNPITYSATNLPGGLSVNQTTGLISGTLTYTSAGVYQVTATVSDQSLTTSVVFTWTITNVNRAPVLSTIADRTGAENTAATLNVVASDPDNDPLIFSAVGLPQELTINPTTGVISGTLSFTSAGLYVVTVSVNDGQGSANSVVSTSFDWTVTDVNRPPVLTRIPDQTNAENDSITLKVIATDPDTDNVLSYSASGLPSGLSINAATGVISGALSYTGAGPHLVSVGVFDGTVTVTESFAWTVTNVDRPPTLAAIANQTNAEGDVVLLATIASDPDGDTLTYTATGLPGGLTIGHSSGAITGTLTYTSAGTSNVTVTVSDGTLTASQAFTWTVANVNRPPVLTNPGNQFQKFGKAFSLQLNGSDPDGTPVSYSATNLPPGLTINPSSGLITGTTSLSSVGVYNVSVTVSDGSLTTTQAFNWRISTHAVVGDFDGDGRTDVAVFRPNDGTWQLLYSRLGYTTSAGITLGAATDIAVPGDYDGDGKIDVAMYRPSTNVWTIILSSTGATQTVTLGSIGDVPAPADYDGDGKTDVAVYTGVTAHWTIVQSSTGATVTTTLGARGDIAVPADYDGDGKADLATYHPSTGLWTILKSTTGTTTTWALGGIGVTPVPADYDGDGQTDAAVYDSGTGAWRIRQSSTGATQSVTLGGPGRSPVPGDYDGDGKIDVAVFGPGQLWTIVRSSDGTTQTVNWGLSTDLPVVLLPSVVADPPVGSDVTRANDYDGDGKSDVVVFRPSNGTWQLLYSRAGYTTSQGIVWGTATDVPVPGDYDGDGKTDPAYWRPSTGQWMILRSSTGATQTVTLGTAGDLPVPGDYDGDGKTDVAIYHPASGLWTIVRSSTGTTQTVTLGASGDAPVRGDYDGDGKTDVAIYHPATGLWTIVRSSDGVTQTITLGRPGLLPVPADYDGDGKADAAVYDPTTGVWQIRQSSTSTVQTVTLGGPGQTPAPADFDGDGKVDVAVFNGSGQWQIQLSSTGTTLAINWGTTGDVVAGNILVADAVSAMRPKSDLLRQTDFDGDGKSDVAVFRPSNGTWQLLYSRAGYTTSAGVTWGTATDIPVPGDYDGDGKTDVAYYRSSTGGWSMILSSTGALQTIALGTLGDVPVPGDYDGDGKTDMAVYHPSSRQWTFVLSKTGATQTVTLGAGGDVPVPADYDGDGKTDAAVYHPATFQWTIQRSSDGTTQTITLGNVGGIPVPGDYDGDGKADAVVYDLTTGNWRQWLSKTGAVQTVTLGGGAGVRPVPADYDGDGVIDLAVMGPGGQWTIRWSSTGATHTLGWGLATDRPVIEALAVIAIPTSTDLIRGTDFDGDGKADIVVYRPSDGTWQQLYSRLGFTTSSATAFGTSTDVPVAGDYDGDGKSDMAYWRPSTAQWVVRASSTGVVQTITLGTTGDLPVPGDYDGDGKTDRVLYRKATAQWILMLSKTGTTQTVTFGVRGDVPVPGDYDGDHITDRAVYHPATGVWTIVRSSDNSTQTVTLGTQGTIPVPGDYDGDGKTDVAVYNPTNGVWTFQLSSTGTTQTVTLGGAGAVPVLGDYDGDGKTDIAVVQPGAHSQWQILYSSTNYASGVTMGWGLGSDLVATNVLLADAIFALRPTPDLQRATDYDGDGKADIVVYRPSDGTWQQLYSRVGFTTSGAVAWGTSTDKPVPGDYDGDGKTDPAYFRPSTGEWRILLSSTGFSSNRTIVLGATTDRLVPGDYDGDGKTDVAIYRPSTGEWQILTSSSNFTTQLTYVLGTSTDVPVPGDYDGDGKMDLAIFRPATRQWQILYSTTNYASGFTAVWGLSTDIPMPADYDGDGKTDIATYRASNGTWQILYSRVGYTTSQGFAWGTPGSVPVVGDYDGDGKADLVLFAGPTWSILLSSTNYTMSLTTGWGLASDKPLPIRP